MGFSKGLKKEFESAMGYKPSVFEPLKFYCICISKSVIFQMLRRIGRLDFFFKFEDANNSRISSIMTSSFIPLITGNFTPTILAEGLDSTTSQ